MEPRPHSATGLRPSSDVLRMSNGSCSAVSLAGSQGWESCAATGMPSHQHQTEVQDQLTDEYFRVVIRIRPPLDRELASPVWQNVVSVSGDCQVCLHEVIPETNAADRASGTSQVVTNHVFSFDHVYDQDASQPDVYASTARASVMSALDGYNASILAYGPTSTGKTYTMEGSRWGDGHGRGIIPRSMEEIFEHISHWNTMQSRVQVRASYLQIYNEIISDLLKPDRSHLVIREDRRRGVFVEGLSEWLCRSVEEVQTLMDHGSAARATAQTGANDASSRSHAVFMIIVERAERVANTEPVTGAGGGAPGHRVQTGRLNLVDLAGSERPRITGATGQRLEETKKINQSLSALGNVISALTERRPRPHVPYRDSKLTRLLEDSLGGNCRTTMMAMVSPAAEAFGESLSTLKFAQRAKGVLNSPQVNEDLDQRMLLRKYEAEIRRLRSELEQGQEPKQFDEPHELQHALAEQENRIHSEYAGRLAGLERERMTVEEDKAQVGRYKQLLLKQRDIMIALTQRLHERDESIMGLQAEIDARDQKLSELQGRAERQALRLAAAEKALQAASNMNPPGPALLSPRQPPPMSVQTALPEAPPSPKWHEGNQPELSDFPRYLPESRMAENNVSEKSSKLNEGCDSSIPGESKGAPSGTVSLMTSDEKVLELNSLLETQRQENHRMALELEGLQDALLPRRSIASVASSMADLPDTFTAGLVAGGNAFSQTDPAAITSNPPQAQAFNTTASTTAPAAATFGTKFSSGVIPRVSTASAAAAAAAAAAAEAAEVARRAGSPMPQTREQKLPTTPESWRHGSTPRGRRSPSQDRGAVGGRPRASSLRPAEKLQTTPASAGPAPSAPATPNGRSASPYRAGFGNARSVSNPSHFAGWGSASASGFLMPSTSTLGHVAAGESQLSGHEGFAAGQSSMGLISAGNAASRATGETMKRSVSAVRPTRGTTSSTSSLVGPNGPVKAKVLSAAVSVAAGNGSAIKPQAPLLSSRPPSPSPHARLSPSSCVPLLSNSSSNAGSLPSSTMSLREEAQRSVDALLARRRAEIRNSASVAAESHHG